MDDKSLQLPDIWNQHQFLKEHSDKSYLFPGVHYEAPQKLPLGISSGWVAGDVESSLVPNRHRQGFLSSIVIGYRFVPQQRYDLKELIKDTSDPDRNALEDAVNFDFGRSMVVMGYSPWEIKIIAGLAAILTYAKNGKFFPYGGLFSPTGGDDPLGWENIALGMEYQRSGQYMYDFFAERGGLGNLDQQRLPAWQASLSRLRMRSSNDEISKIIENTEMRRHAIERASQTGITTQQALRDIKTEETQVRSTQEPKSHESVDRLWMTLRRMIDVVERAKKEEAERKQRARENSERVHAIDMQVRSERILEQRERMRDREVREKQDRARDTQAKDAPKKEKKAKEDAGKRGTERPRTGEGMIFGPKR